MFNEVTVEITEAGIISFVSGLGSMGRAQLTNSNTFSLRADAQLQFEGRCQSGVINLTGQVLNDEVIATFTSADLVCLGTPHTVEGTLTANQMAMASQ